MNEKGVRLESKGRTTVAYVSGDVDHHTARAIRAAIDREINQGSPELLVIDMEGVSFMDSSGIGLIMGRYKLMSDIGGRIIVARPPEYIRKVLRLAGVDKLGTITDREYVLEEKEAERLEQTAGQTN